MNKNIEEIILNTKVKALEATKLEKEFSALESDTFVKLEELLTARRELEEIELQWFFAVDKEGQIAFEDALLPMVEFDDSSKKGIICCDLRN